MSYQKNVQSDTENFERAAIYARVSTKRQNRKGYSIENQVDEAKKFAEDKFIIPDELVFIEDLSASKFYNKEIDYEAEEENFLNRPELQKLIICAKDGMFKHLLVYSRDRLSRVVEQSLLLQSLLNKYGVEIHYTKKGESLNNENESINRFIHLILSSVAELESSILSTRVKEGNKSCIEKGLWAGGRIPLGYVGKVVKRKEGKVNSRLEKSYFEKKVVNEVFELYQLGLGYERIANRMNYKHGYIKWTKSKVEAIIKNETYTGNVVWNRRGGRRNPVKHEEVIRAKYNQQLEIIKRANWDEVVDIRKEREKKPDPYLHQTPFIFKGKLYCELCKKEMVSKNPGNKKSPVYYCTNKKSEHDNTCYHRIPTNKIDEEFFKFIRIMLYNEIEDYNELYGYYKNSFEERKNLNKEFLQALKKKIEELSRKSENIKKLIRDEKSKSIQKALESQVVYNENILKKYKELEAEYEKQVKKHLIIFNDFNKKAWDLLEKIDSSEEKRYSDEFDEINTKRFVKRNFVIHFIDKIYILYNKKTGKVTITKIELL